MMTEEVRKAWRQFCDNLSYGDADDRTLASGRPEASEQMLSVRFPAGSRLAAARRAASQKRTQNGFMQLFGRLGLVRLVVIAEGHKAPLPSEIDILRARVRELEDALAVAGSEFNAALGVPGPPILDEWCPPR